MMITTVKLLTLLLAPAMAMAADHGMMLRRAAEEASKPADNITLLPPKSGDRNKKAFQVDVDFADFDSFNVTVTDDEDEQEGHHARKLWFYTSEEYNQAAYVQYERVNNGLQEVYFSADLQDEAQRWASYMASTGDFSHRNPLSQNIDGWSSLAENIAINPSVSYDGAHTSFMNSPGHRANILNPDMNRIGVGVVAASDGSYYVCQIFKQV